MIFNTDTRVLFEKAFYFSSIGMALVSNDGRFLRANPAICSMFGYNDKELAEKTFMELTHPGDRLDSASNYEEMMAGKISSFETEKRYVTKQGNTIWVLLSVSMVKNDQGECDYFISQFQDISSRKYYERELEDSKQKLTQIIETVPAGVLMSDLDGRFIFANKMAEHILQLKKKDILNRKFDNQQWHITTVDGEPVPNENLPFRQIIRTRKSLQDYIIGVKTGSGATKIISVNGTPLFGYRGEMTKVLFSLVDITYEKQTEQDLIEANKLLKKLSESDGLTGIPNRRYFDEQLALAWKQCTESESPVSLIMFDLDCFKFYNDCYGHQAGDDCLKTVAEAANQLSKETGGILTRYGGEEFAVILPGVSKEDARDIAVRLLEEVASLQIPHETSTVLEFVTVSAGVSAMMPGKETNHLKLLKHADEALYLSKKHGRNTVTVY